MGGNYLIPANSKKSKLILGYFNIIDLIIFTVGVTSTLMLLLLVKSSNLTLTLLIISPAIISAFLVMPVPNYHNILTLLSNIYNYFTRPREYRWKGWCYKDE